jgi:hypothetical protein
MPEWSIKIVPVDPTRPAGSAQFVPQDAPAGQPLATWDGDLVTWNNTTDTAHWPWPTDSNYNPLPVTSGTTAYMSDDIAARQGSRPTYSVNLPPPPPPGHRRRRCRISSTTTARITRPIRMNGGRSRS